MGFRCGVILSLLLVSFLSADGDPLLLKAGELNGLWMRTKPNETPEEVMDRFWNGIFLPKPQIKIECGVKKEETTESVGLKIVGGTESQKWPWIVALINVADTSTSFCGGSLITERHILTAAHCVVNYTTSNLKVRLGEYDFRTVNDSDHIDFQVVNIEIHNQFNVTSLYDYDIAILKIEPTVVFNDYIRPICIPPIEFNLKDVPGIIIGWGKVSEYGPYSNILRQASVAVWEQRRCEQAYNFRTISHAMFCAGDNRGGKDSCTGDSGGPFMANIGNYLKPKWSVAGVVSFGSGCARRGRPGVYVRVNELWNWIDFKTYDRVFEPLA